MGTFEYANVNALRCPRDHESSRGLCWFHHVFDSQPCPMLESMNGRSMPTLVFTEGSTCSGVDDPEVTPKTHLLCLDIGIGTNNPTPGMVSSNKLSSVFYNLCLSSRLGMVDLNQITSRDLQNHRKKHQSAPSSTTTTQWPTTGSICWSTVDLCPTSHRHDM